MVAWINARFHARIYEDAYSPLCLITSTNGDMDLILDHLEHYCRRVPDLTVVRNDVYARFSHRAYNKGTALAEITRRLGLSREAVFAAGDHLNDLPMLSRGSSLPGGAGQRGPTRRAAVLEQGGYVGQASQGAGWPRRCDTISGRAGLEQRP
jgi:hypothetical protein